MVGHVQAKSTVFMDQVVHFPAAHLPARCLPFESRSNVERNCLTAGRMQLWEHVVMNQMRNLKMQELHGIDNTDSGDKGDHRNERQQTSGVLDTSLRRGRSMVAARSAR